MSNRSVWFEIGRLIRQLISRSGAPTLSPKRPHPQREQHPRSAERPRSTTASGQSPFTYESSPGQFGAGATRDTTPDELRRVRLEYAPQMDGDPDPGEVVWTWVPYVENDGRGKDRPVLIIGRIDAATVVGCYVSTKHHRNFISIGQGDWDAQGRESFLSPERILRITHDGMRREGALVSRDAFTAAVRGVLAFHGISKRP